jgi:subtilisin family serine protease
MDPLEQIKLYSLMKISSGKPEIAIGLIDGPIDFNHPAFQGAKIRTAKDSQLSACKSASSIACMHGTFIAGILCSKRDSAAPAICPSCEIILRPIFTEDTFDNIAGGDDSSNIVFPSSTPKELSKAIIEIVDAGATIINLSLGLSTSSLTIYRELEEAYNYALQHNVIIVVATGNQGNIGYISLLNHPWIIPVAACNEHGTPVPQSNFGPTIGKQGLMAPGVNITSTLAGDGVYTKMSGTSVAVPFVTGTIALLWSIFPDATAEQIIHSITGGIAYRSRTIIPPLLNAEGARIALKTFL